MSRGGRSRRPALAAALRLLGLLALLLAAGRAAWADDAVETGRRIYQQGVLSSGQPLVGQRDQGGPVEGATAACVNCHRPSGMGSVEGDVRIPPINATYLFNLSLKGRANMDTHVSKLLNQAHPPYDDASLAHAIRDGVDVTGRQMSPVMPRFALSARDLEAVTAYLRQLTTRWSPGVTAQRLRFATVITPEVDDARRQVFKDMMRAAVSQHNGSILNRSHMTTAAEMVLRTQRKWDLDVWELEGPPQSWPAQLEAHYQAQPVFAILSGLSLDDWTPVHDFCRRERMPCWFPSVDAAPVERDGYGLYFNRGVALESDVLAQWLHQQADAPRRLFSAGRESYATRRAAETLGQDLRPDGIAVIARTLSGDAAAGVEGALREALPGDAVVLWLRREDLAGLGQVALPAGVRVYVSAGIAAGEDALPAAWRERVQLIYPFELPQERPYNLAYFDMWLQSRKIPVVDRVMQSEVYFALTCMTDMLSDMLDNLYRDYLVERAETMLGRREGMRAEEEARDRPSLGYRAPYAGNRASGALPPPRGGDVQVIPVGHTQSTTLFPRLTLAAGQRFASRGAYVARFAAPGSADLKADSEWIVPHTGTTARDPGQD